MTKLDSKNPGWGRYDFLGLAKFFVVGTGSVVLASLVLMATRGLNYGVDYRGGVAGDRRGAVDRLPGGGRRGAHRDRDRRLRRCDGAAGVLAVVAYDEGTDVAV